MIIKFAIMAYLFLVMLFFVAESNAFQCYVCDSKNDIECLENLPPNSRLESQDCHNITGAKFCIKTTNLYAGKSKPDDFYNLIEIAI